MFRSLVQKLAIVLLVSQALPAAAQWQVPQYSIPVGKGQGFTGFNSAAPGAAGTVLMSNGVAANPTFQVPALPSNAVTPEQFYQTADGADWGPAWRRAVTYLTGLGGGEVIGGCRTYLFNTLSSNSMIVPASNIALSGCGVGITILKMGDNLNTSSASFANGIYTSGTAENFYVHDLTIDMNGANNRCGGAGTCYHSNAALGVGTFTYSYANNVGIINNPGSNDTVYGTNVQPPTGINLFIGNLFHNNGGDRVNAAATDFSADFFIAKNVSIGSIAYYNGPTVNGSAFEVHGTNIVAGKFVVSGYFNCGIVANEPAGVGSLTTNVNLGVVSCFDVKGGVQLYSKAGATTSNINVNNIVVNYLSGASGISVDACSNMLAGSVGNTNLSINTIIHNSDVTTNLGNEAPAVSVCRWKVVTIGNILGTNSQGPAISFDNIISGANITVAGGSFENPGRTATAANQVGIRFINTSGNVAGNIGITNFKTTGTVQYNISSNVAATQASIDSASLAAGATLGQWNVPGAWSGTIWPQFQINFRGTGPGVVQQASAAGILSVGSVANAFMATMATNTIKGNATSGSATPTDLAIGSCDTATKALQWTTNTGFGCNSSITANLATTATNATNSAITDDTTTNATMFPAWVTTASGNQAIKTSSTKVTWNPSTGVYTVPVISATTSVNLGSKVVWSASAPNINSGFCTSPSIISANGTAAFVIQIGTACGAATGVINTPTTANNGWACRFSNTTNPDANKPDQTASTTTTVSVKNYSRTSGLPSNWTASDNIVGQCASY